MAASDMLICGEDLGFVPACLPPVMQVRAVPACRPTQRFYRAQRTRLRFLVVGLQVSARMRVSAQNRQDAGPEGCPWMLLRVTAIPQRGTVCACCLCRSWG
jgi:hypothetical protein